MASPEPWIFFVVATITFACMPGPAILYMTAQTLAHGRRAGLLSALGVHIGCYAHIIAASIGLASLIANAPAVYAAIRFAGAAYLIWLGLMMVFGQCRPDTGRAVPQATTLRDSIVVEVLNPKTALFFVTFLPQFVETGATMPVWLQFLILGLVVNTAFSAMDLAAVACAALIRDRLRSGAALRIVPNVCGAILIGLGIALAAAHDAPPGAETAGRPASAGLKIKLEREGAAHAPS